MGERVFISYSSSDVARANAFRKGLMDAGHDVWMAPYSIPDGVDFPSAIMEGIEACSVVVLVLSRASNSSKYVQREIQRAVSRNIRIIPARIENVVPSGGLEFLISNLQWVEARENDPGPSVTRLQAALTTDDNVRAKAPLQGYVTLNASTIAWIVAGLLGVTAIGARWANPSFAGLGLIALAGATGLAALAGFLLQLRGWKPGVRPTFRWGDLAAASLVIVAVAISVVQLLFTPALIAIAVFALYIAARGILSLRGWVVAGVGAAAIVAAVIYGDGVLYRSLDQRAQTLLVLPKRCNQCDDLGQTVYTKLVDVLGIAIQPHLRLYPGLNQGKLPEGEYSRLKYVIDDQRLRPQMLVRTILGDQDVDDDVMRLSITKADNGCGQPSAQVQFFVNRWLPGTPGAWPSWRWVDRQLGEAQEPVYVRIENGEPSARDIEIVAYLLAANLLERLTASPEGADERLWESARTFLNELTRPEGADPAVRSGGADNATHEATTASLAALSTLLRAGLPPAPTQAACDQANRRTRALVSARFNVALNQPQTAAPPADGAAPAAPPAETP